jgi:uncharacterized protein with HEPN domain
MTELPGQTQDHITATYGVRARQALLDLRAFIALGDGLTAQGRADFDENIYLRLSAEAIVHRVGEAVARLPAALVQAHPEIEFSLAKAMRNRVAHRYQSVDYAILWEALAVDLPLMSGQVAALLARRSK